ncbi:hypothetical protein GCM10022419_052390 [Nonomuraea rosea]|uniref:Uncharacterized protein n=1 Tax=Nonomuraea rosea TaxID=638574 RepID=A0ABP6XCZ1_9ACTN
MGAGHFESSVVAGPGGVMTGEAGVITGELTVRTETGAGRVSVRIQYVGADEWYEVEGSPLETSGAPVPQLHQEILQAVRRGMPDGLAGFQPAG